MKIEVEEEEDGRWIAEILELPGCITYGKTRNDALSKAKTIALRVLAVGQGEWIIKKKRSILGRILPGVKPAQNNLTFSDGSKVGPRMLARISKRTGLKPEDF